MEIFEKFFGDKNPFTFPIDEVIDPIERYLDGTPYVEAPENITVTVDCTLYEFYNGCLKKIEYDRVYLLED